MSDGAIARWLYARERPTLIIYETLGGGHPPAIGVGWGITYWCWLRGFLSRDRVGYFQLTDKGRRRLNEGRAPSPELQAMAEKFRRVTGGKKQ